MSINGTQCEKTSVFLHHFATPPGPERSPRAPRSPRAWSQQAAKMEEEPPPAAPPCDTVEGSERYTVLYHNRGCGVVVVIQAWTDKGAWVQAVNADRVTITDHARHFRQVEGEPLSCSAVVGILAGRGGDSVTACQNP